MGTVSTPVPPLVKGGGDYWLRSEQDISKLIMQKKRQKSSFFLTFSDWTFWRTSSFDILLWGFPAAQFWLEPNWGILLLSQIQIWLPFLSIAFVLFNLFSFLGIPSWPGCCPGAGTELPPPLVPTQVWRSFVILVLSTWRELTDNIFFVSLSQAIQFFYFHLKLCVNEIRKGCRWKQLDKCIRERGGQG